MQGIGFFYEHTFLKSPLRIISGGDYSEYKIYGDGIGFNITTYEVWTFSTIVSYLHLENKQTREYELAYRLECNIKTDLILIYQYGDLRKSMFGIGIRI